MWGEPEKKMVEYNANTLYRSAIAPSQPALKQQPAGGWGNWLGDTTTPPDESIAPGTTIYTFTAAELLKLRTNGLITDETYVYFRSRALNQTKQTASQTQVSTDYSPLTPGRLFRALAALEKLALISRFSIDDVNISWIRITPALTEAEIRDKWRRQLWDSTTYCNHVLNFLRAGATTQVVDVRSLWNNWEISELTLGDSLNSLQSKAVITTYMNSVSIEWFTPLRLSSVTFEEIKSLWSRGVIGQTLYIYTILRSLKGATAAQAVDAVFLLENYAIAPTALYSVLVSLLEQSFLSALDITNITISWIDPKPTLQLYRVKETERTLFKDAGLMMYAIALEGDTINIDNIVLNWRIASTKKSTAPEIHKLGLKLINRLVESDVISIKSLPQFSITWI